MNQIDGNSELEYEPSDSEDTESNVSDSDTDIENEIEELLPTVIKSVTSQPTVSQLIPTTSQASESEDFLSCNSSVKKEKASHGPLTDTLTTVFIESFDLDIASAPNDQVLLNN